MNNKPLKLIETSWELFGARLVLANLHDMGCLILDPCGKENKQEKQVYNDAAYELLMNDDIMLQEWLAVPGNTRWKYYDYEIDKKGKLAKCKAERI